MILILYENSHYITPYKKNCFFLNIYIFLFTITFQFLFHFRCWRRPPYFNDILFALEIPKDLILLCVDYDIVLRLENVENQK